MEDKTAEIKYLFSRYLNQLSTREEYDQLLKLLGESESDATLKALLNELWPQLAQEHPSGLPTIQHTEKEKRNNLPFLSTYYRIAAAAIILIALSLGTYFYFANHTGPNNEQSASSRKRLTSNNDIDPGGNKAILTLANGRKIMLDEAAKGELAEESGIKITKTEDGQVVYEVADARIADARQPKAGSAGWRASAMRDPATYNTIETPKGGQYKIILPDSSVVWLNAASSLRYPTRFSGEERRVELTGEAFFEISSKYQVEEKRRSRDIGNASIKTPSAHAGGDGNKSKIVNRTSKIPFIVATATQEVQVLGTQFNINAYTDEPMVKTTLVEGAVRVASTSAQSTNKLTNQSTNQPINPPVVGHGQSTTLRPGQQSVLSGQSLALVNVDPEEAIAWKKGYFMFESEDIYSIMRKIARWYDVEVVYSGDVPTDKFWGTVSRFEKVSQVLRKLELTNKVHFKIEERRIVVTR